MTTIAGGNGGFAKIARDMTAHQQLQSSRDAQLAREQASNESKDQFLAVMSHELKHPLNLIQVNTELLLNQPEVRSLPAVARSGETIRLAIESQTKIIDDLLDLSRARTGKLTLRPGAVGLRQLVLLIASAAQPAAREKGVELEVDCGASEIVAFCDRVRTEQILWNLINNAIKFTPAGGSAGVRLAQELEFARVSVTDTGRGIPFHVQAHIFDRFIGRDRGGPGLALALVKALTELHGGWVALESEPGAGATFTCHLPERAYAGSAHPELAF